MIHFIVGEDNVFIHKQILDIIDKVMFKGAQAYKKEGFYDYDDSFVAKIDEPLSNKIYILDIETPSNTGIEMARKIREKDIDSIIIFLTAYGRKYTQTILENEFMFFAFLSKKKDYEILLEEKIRKAITLVSKKKAIRFCDCGTIYTILTKDILYVTTDTQERKILIVTDYTTHKVGKSMIEMEELLGEEFMQTHKSCIINKNRINRIDMREGIIYFDTGVQIDLLSRKFKKTVKKEILSYN